MYTSYLKYGWVRCFKRTKLKHKDAQENRKRCVCSLLFQLRYATSVRRYKVTRIVAKTTELLTEIMQFVFSVCMFSSLYEQNIKYFTVELLITANRI